MLSEVQIKKLDTYFGFAMKKRAIYVGLKMEEMVERKKLNYIVVLPTCSEKKFDEISSYRSKNPNLVIFRYTGDGYSIRSILGYEMLNAVGVDDINLAKAIQSLLEEDMK